MANLSQFTGSVPTVDGTQVVTRFVTESEYEAIALVSDSTLGTFNTADPNNYDPLFDHTLYYIQED